MLSRRALVSRLAAGTAAVWASSSVVLRGSASAKEVQGDGRAYDVKGNEKQSSTESIPAPWSLLRPLSAGSIVAHGWRVAELSAIEHGSFVLTLKNDRGRVHRIHICRNNGRPEGIVHTRDFDLVVMNGGQGDLPTDESFARAVARVGRLIESNRTAAREVKVALLSHAERLRLFQESVGARLR